jgi:hypothetical protein
VQRMVRKSREKSLYRKRSLTSDWLSWFLKQ